MIYKYTNLIRDGSRDTTQIRHNLFAKKNGKITKCCALGAAIKAFMEQHNLEEEPTTKAMFESATGRKEKDYSITRTDLLDKLDAMEIKYRKTEFIEPRYTPITTTYKLNDESTLTREEIANVIDLIFGEPIKMIIPIRTKK